MKYMLIMRATDEGVEAYKDIPFEEVIDAMGGYNESMVKAGVLVAGEGLTDASRASSSTSRPRRRSSPTAPTARRRSCSTASGSSRSPRGGGRRVGEAGAARAGSNIEVRGSPR